MAKAEVTVKVSEIEEVAGLVKAARAVRDELHIRGDHGISVDVERQLIEALAALGA